MKTLFERMSDAAKGIEAGTDETPQAAQPEGQEPGPEGVRPGPGSILPPTTSAGDGELVGDWQITDAECAHVTKLEDVFDEDGGPLWEASIECSGGYAQAATVVGGSEKDARQRGIAVASALRGTPVAHAYVNLVERLLRGDDENGWEAAEAIQRLDALNPSPTEQGEHDAPR